MYHLAFKGLKKVNDRLENKKERERIKAVHLDAQLKSTLHSNKSTKENLKGYFYFECHFWEIIIIIIFLQKKTIPQDC